MTNAPDRMRSLTAEHDAPLADASIASTALYGAWVREAKAIAERDAALDACNQARMAFAGYVSVGSAIKKLDAVLSSYPTTRGDG